MERTFKTEDGLRVRIFATRSEMGRAAAEHAAALIREHLQTHETMHAIFAAAPSQNEFLAELLRQNIDFERIHAFHMDEYVGLPADAPQGFGNFLRRTIFDKVPFAGVHYINGQAADCDAECKRYGALLQAHVPDIVFMGIGENGHIAFNDPPVADFHDAHLVKKVELDHMCRQQQVNDGCFAALEEVPRFALTVTVPGLMRAAHHICVVPGTQKAAAVRNTLLAPVGEQCPATALRRAADAVLYLDEASAGALH